MSEHDEQSAVIAWARLSEGRWPCLRWLHSSLNGIWLGGDRSDEKARRRSFAIIAKQRAAGLVKGIPDLFLPYPAKGYHGLYIEMKKHGKLSTVRDEQKDFLAYAESVEYLAQAFDNAEDAIASIQDYLS